MSTEAKQLLSKAGLRTSEFWALLVAMAITPVCAHLGVSDSVLMAMWGGVSTYIGGRTWGKNAAAKAVASIEVIRSAVPIKGPE